MVIGSGLSLSSLIEMCRVLRHYLGAGLSLLDVFQQQKKRGRGQLQALSSRVCDKIEQGESLEDALKHEKALPPLFIALAVVGEETGMLPEVFADLETYYLRQQQLRRQFLARIAWPVIQFTLAVFVLAGLIWFLGQISGPGIDGKPYDPLGLGLRGTWGALIFLGVIWGSIFAVALLWWGLSRLLARNGAADRFLLGLPVIGPCMQALALGRFSLALRLTTETGMSIKRAIRLSMRATGNGAFEAASPKVEAAIREGEDLTMALASTRLFPLDFEHILSVAEESGTLSDVLKHQAEHYHEEASRRLAFLTGVASYAVWLATGAAIVVAIFRLYGSYLNVIKTPI